VRLRVQPLFETIFEFRFDPTQKTVSELTPGLLYSELGEEYPESELQPIGTVPREMRARDQRLMHVASHRLIGPEGVIQIGDRVLGVAKTHPYRGWADFQERITRFLTAVRKLSLVDRVKRCSMKSVNILAPAEPHQLTRIRASLSLAGQPIPEAGFLLRTEYREGSNALVVQIHPNATATLKDSGPRTGLLVDLDYIESYQPAMDLWRGPEALVDRLHNTTKSAFFALLTAETLASLGPEY
jgi:uncharacterized protein (TIGR04255 family)